MAVDDLLTKARDVGYTAVGFGVLGAQQLQVKRRELARELGRRVGGKAGVARIVKRVDDAVDPVLDTVEKRLPGQARFVFRSARVAGRAFERAVLR